VDFASELVASFPRPLVVVDGSLQVCAFSDKVRSLFVLSSQGDSGESCTRLSAAIEESADLGDAIALATARLLGAGDEERFTWSHRGRSYEVVVVATGATGERFAVLFEDVTHRSMSEDILTNARRHLEQMLDSIPLGVVVLNEGLRITSINRRQLEFLARLGIGLDLLDAVGSTLADSLSGELGGRWQALCESAAQAGERVEEHRETFATAGGDLVLSIMATPLINRESRSVGAMLVCEDVSEQTRLEQELLRVEKLATIGQMVITVNHEINNPLNIISNNAQTMRLLNPDLDEKLLTKLHTIEAQVRRISEVTARLREMDDVTTNDYIAEGPQMVDVWNKNAHD
jgi:PAS domain S-box-containing protein